MLMSEAKRIDIQALRGLAIIAVLINHLSVPNKFLENGFRGVDMFFVISGFVITNSLIRQSVNHHKISPVNFLLQRVRRLYPAFFVLMVANLIILISVNWMPYMERGVIESAVAGTWYFQNFWMINQNFSYFEPSFANPFTHMWSLSVEEQFYLLVAIGLVILRFVKRKKSFTIIAILLLFTLSALASLKWGETESPLIKFSGELSAFLLPQYRAWQILLGVIVAWTVSYFKQIKPLLVALSNPWLRTILYLAALTAIAVSLKITEPHGGYNSGEFRVRIFATIICTATALILFLGSFHHESKSRAMSTNTILRTASFFGDRSYSLYLVHWPIIVFMPEFFLNDRYLWMVELTATLLCTEIIYRSVEWTWIRRSLKNRQVFAWFVVGQILLSSVIFAWRKDFLKVDPAKQGLAINTLIDPQCGMVDLPFRCVIENNSNLTIFVEGDSFALMVSPLIIDLARKYQLNVAFGIDVADLPMNYYENLKATTGKQIVVLSWFRHYDPNSYIEHVSGLLSQKDTLRVFAFLNGPRLSGDRLQNVSRAEFFGKRNRELELKSALLIPEFEKLTVVDPLNYFCEDDVCSLRSREQIFLTDRDHLSSTGVEKLRPLFEEIFLETEKLDLKTKNN